MEEVKYLILDNGVEIPIATTDYPWVAEWDWRWDEERHQIVAGPEEKPLFLYSEMIRIHVQRGGDTLFCLPTARLVAVTNKHLDTYGYYRRYTKELDKLCHSESLILGNVANVYGLGLGRALGMYLSSEEEEDFDCLGEYLESTDIGGGDTLLDVLGHAVITDLIELLMRENPDINAEQVEKLMDSDELQRLVFTIVNMIGNYPLE